MPSAVRTLGFTVAASLGLHGGIMLLAATAMTVLPAWSPGSGRTSARPLKVARSYKAGDKYSLTTRVQHESPPPSPIAGKMLVTLTGVWEIQEVTPQAGQPRKYTFTVGGSEVISGDRAGAMFIPGTVIAGFIDPSSQPAWTANGVAVEGPMKNLFRNALPVPAVQDVDELAACFQPPAPVSTGDTWAFNAPAVAARLAADGFQLAEPPAGAVTLSAPVDWEGEIPARQIQITMNGQASAVPGLPAGSEVKSAVFKGEGEVLLPNTHSLPVLHEKWTTEGILLCRLPGKDEFGPLSAITIVERDFSLFVPDESEPQEVEVTFVPDAQIPAVTSKLPKPVELVPAEPQPKPAPKKGPIHVVAREDMPSVMAFNDDTPFISDRNMRASATGAPVAGADPRIGSQEGVELPGLSLFNAQARLAGVSTPPPAPPTPPPAPETPPEPVVKETPPPPAAPPETPKEDRPPEKAVVQTSDPNAPAPPQKLAETPAMRDRPPDPIALNDAKPRPRPPIKAVDPVKPSTKNPGAKPVVSSVKSKVQGSLAIRGSQSSVDAKDTPEGRFYSAMHDSIGLIWNTRLASVHGLSGSGVVEVEFDIDINGRVSNVKLVEGGSANPVLEDVCLTSVIKAKIPPLPESLKREIQDPLSGGKLHQKINFYKIPRP